MQHPSAQYEFDAMGTRWWCELLREHTFPNSLKKSINQLVNDFIQNYSRFENQSLVSALNTDGKISNPPAELIAMMNFAHEMYDASEGAFNISVGGTLHQLGYGSYARRNVARQDFWDNTTVARRAITIPDNTTIDFGGFGKGWLIDEIGLLMQKSNITEFIINGGGDILVSSTEPVELALEHPTKPNRMVGTISLTHGALAVSSNVKRAWTVRGQRKHHIIDPLTNDSILGPARATYVVAKTARIADTIATTLMVRPEVESHLHNQYDFQLLQF